MQFSGCKLIIFIKIRWYFLKCALIHSLNQFPWRADVGMPMVVFGSSLPSSTKKKIVVKVRPPLAKLSGSAQEAQTRLSLHCEHFMMYERYLSCDITIV